MAKSTRLVILIKNIYTLWGRKRFLLPVTYFPMNLVYPFTLRVTGIKTGDLTTSEKIWEIIKISFVSCLGQVEVLIFNNFPGFMFLKKSCFNNFGLKKSYLVSCIPNSTSSTYSTVTVQISPSKDV